MKSRNKNWPEQQTDRRSCATQRFRVPDKLGRKRVPNIFRPGDQAPTTGIYRVFHGREHAEGHYVIALKGDIFPACRECLDNVRFDVAVSAAHVNAHPLFKRQPA